MITHFPTSVDWFFLGLYIAITLISFYQTWENLINKRFSKFAFDALILILINRLGNDRARKQAKLSAKDSTRLIAFGIYALAAGIGGIYETIRWLNIYSWH